MKKQKIVGIAIVVLVFFSTLATAGFNNKEQPIREMLEQNEEHRTDRETYSSRFSASVYNNLRGTVKNCIQSRLFQMREKLEKKDQHKMVETNGHDEKIYYVTVGPAGVKDSSNCETIKIFNETGFKQFETDVNELKTKSLDGYEMMAEQFNILIKYDIFPDYFTFENLTKAIEEYKQLSTPENNKLIDWDDDDDGGIQIGRRTVGPHMILYGSLFSSVVNFQPFGKYLLPEPISDIKRLIDIFNISEGTMFYDYIYNISIFHYMGYIPFEFLIGGSMGCYVSLGLFPGMQSFYLLNTPFIGEYVFFFTAGLYIYEGHEWDEGVDNALMDFIIGLCPYSTVTYKNFKDPTP